MRSLPGAEATVLEPRALYADDASHVSLGPSHLVGRASGASHRHGSEKGFHHAAADVLSGNASDLAAVSSVFPLHAGLSGIAEHCRIGDVRWWLAAARPAKAKPAHACRARR